MAITDRYHPNFEGNERINLPDLVAVRDRLISDFKFFIRTFIDGYGSRIGKLYEAGTHSGLTFNIRKDINRKFHDKNFDFVFAEGSSGYNSVALAPSATNYIGVRIKYRPDDLQTRPFWDTDLGTNGEEFFDDIYIKIMIEEEFTSSASPLNAADGWLTLWTATTDAGAILVVTSVQDHLWHPRSFSLLGALARDNQYNSIEDLRGYIDLAAALAAELKGTGQLQESKPWSSIKLLREFQNFFYYGGGEISFEKRGNSIDPNKLEWSSPIYIQVAGRGYVYQIDASNVTLLTGNCLYVDIPEGAPSGSLVPVVVPLESVPVGPTITATSPGIMVLFFRSGGTVYGALDIPELSTEETATIGLDLPKKLRERLGIISESQYEAYTNTYSINSGDNYPAAISKLDAKIQWMLENIAQEELIVLGSDTDTVNATTMVWGADVDDVDITVFVNKLPQTQDVSGGLGEDFRKQSSTQLRFSYTLKAGWQVRIRDERTGSRGVGGAQLYQPTLVKEVPTGTKDGTNKVFVLSQNPIASSYMLVSLDRGITEGWTLQNSNEIHFDDAPQPSQYLEVFYFIPTSGGGGGVDLSAVNQDIIPDTSGLRSFGTTTKAWKNLYLQDQVTGDIYRLRLISGVLDVESV